MEMTRIFFQFYFSYSKMFCSLLLCALCASLFMRTYFAVTCTILMLTQTIIKLSEKKNANDIEMSSKIFAFFHFCFAGDAVVSLALRMCVKICKRNPRRFTRPNESCPFWIWSQPKSKAENVIQIMWEINDKTQKKLLFLLLLIKWIRSALVFDKAENALASKISTVNFFFYHCHHMVDDCWNHISSPPAIATMNANSFSLILHLGHSFFASHNLPFLCAQQVFFFVLIVYTHDMFLWPNSATFCTVDFLSTWRKLKTRQKKKHVEREKHKWEFNW